MKYQIEIFPNGQASLKDMRIGESMHSKIGPWEEANMLYIQQSRLAERLTQPSKDPLVIFDVGLGMGSNAIAAIETSSQLEQQVRPLQIFSFEIDSDGLSFALENKDRFSFLTKHEPILSELLEKRALIRTLKHGSQLYWQLILGDFRTTLSALPAPELIFYDLYSPKSCPHLWNYRCFNSLFQITEKRRQKGLESILVTYSAATSVRSALLLSGFYVGQGVQTSGKLETTIASTQIFGIERPLDSQWLEHWKRSSKPLPEDSPSNNILLKEIGDSNIFINIEYLIFRLNIGKFDAQ
jgi:queuine tRNA-ribosyltransferase